MSRWIKRVSVIAVFGAIAIMIVRRRSAASTTAAAAPTSTWPPFETAAEAVAAPAWLPSVDGTNPDGYPIKANDNSRIFHVPGGRFYERTSAERCYATAEGAERDGYRRAKA